MALKKAIAVALIGRISGSEHDYARVMEVTSFRRDRDKNPIRLFGRYADNNQPVTHHVDFVLGWFRDADRAEKARGMALNAGRVAQFKIDNMHEHIRKFTREKQKDIDLALSQMGAYHLDLDDI